METDAHTTTDATSVYGYFEQLLGSAPTDATLAELPTDSVCGQDCVAVIYAAKMLLNRCDPHPGVREHILAGVNMCIEIYWRG